MSEIYFDLVGTIHGREYSDHGQYVTADDYYHIQLYSEAIARLKLGLEQDMEKLQEQNEYLRRALSRIYDSIEREYWSEYAGLDDTKALLNAAMSQEFNQ